MTFQCNDLDHALESPDLMPAALAHAESCPRCREQIDLWNDISRLAPQLHQDWETPHLWTRIRAEITADEASRRRVVPIWQWTLAAAASLVLIGFLWRTALHETATVHHARPRELLTEQALRDVQETEAAYVRSIARLSAVAGKTLDQSSTPLAGAYRDKLAVLDAAIADLKSTIETNPYNTYLETELASLYRAKQQTLEEWINHAQSS